MNNEKEKFRKTAEPIMVDISGPRQPHRLPSGAARIPATAGFTCEMGGGAVQLTGDDPNFCSRSSFALRFSIWSWW